MCSPTISCNCGIHPDTLPAWRVPDIIDTQAGSVHLSGETRPVWVTVEVPRDAKPGKYKETLSVDGQQDITQYLRIGNDPAQALTTGISSQSMATAPCP